MAPVPAASTNASGFGPCGLPTCPPTTLNCYQLLPRPCLPACLPAASLQRTSKCCIVSLNFMCSPSLSIASSCPLVASQDRDSLINALQAPTIRTSTFI